MSSREQRGLTGNDRHKSGLPQHQANVYLSTILVISNFNANFTNTTAKSIHSACESPKHINGNLYNICHNFQKLLKILHVYYVLLFQYTGLLSFHLEEEYRPSALRSLRAGFFLAIRKCISALQDRSLQSRIIAPILWVFGFTPPPKNEPERGTPPPSRAYQISPLHTSSQCSGRSFSTFN